MSFITLSQTTADQSEATNAKSTKIAAIKKQAEQNFFEVLNFSPVSMLITDLETGDITISNKKLEQLLGYSAEELKQTKTVQLYMNPAVRSHVLDQLDKNNFIDNYEVQFQKKDGSTIDVLLSSEKIRIDDANLCLSGLIDITERKQIEDTLHKSENNLKSIFENTKTGYALLDTELKIMSFNSNIQKFAQQDLQATLKVGDNIINSFSESRKQAVLEIMQQVLQGETISYQTKYPQADNSERWYNVKFFPVYNDAKDILGLVMSMDNISKRKKTESDLEKSLETLTEQNKRLLNFSYIVSHNLRSHASNIKSILHFIKNAESEEERNEFLEHLQTVSESLDNTMQNLNDVVSIHSNLNLKLETLNLNFFIEKAINVLREQIESKMVLVHNLVAANTTVNYNPAYLESIIFNFLSNAIKYSSPDRQPTVVIDSYTENNKMVLRFADNGIGLDLKKYGSKLFGMYKTFHGNKDSKGIGLFITKNQVEAMNGKIEVESVLDKGSTFKIFL